MSHFHTRANVDVGFIVPNDNPHGIGLSDLIAQTLLALPEVDWVRHGHSVWTSDGGHHSIPDRDGAA